MYFLSFSLYGSIATACIAKVVPFRSYMYFFKNVSADPAVVLAQVFHLSLVSLVK